MGVEPIRLQDMGRLAMPSVGADARATRIPAGGNIPNTYSPASQGPNFSIGLFLKLSRFLSLFATPSLGQGSGCWHSFTQHPFPCSVLETYLLIKRHSGAERWLSC